MAEGKKIDTIKDLSLFMLGVFLVIVGLFSALYFREIRYSVVMQPEIVNIEPADAYSNILSSQKILFLDVRTKNEYDLAHASSSISMPIHTLLEQKDILPKGQDTQIYLICNGGSLAGVAYGYLEHNGFINIHRVRGGIKEWYADGQPMLFRDKISEIRKDLLNESTK